MLEKAVFSNSGQNKASMDGDYATRLIQRRVRRKKVRSEVRPRHLAGNVGAAKFSNLKDMFWSVTRLPLSQVTLKRCTTICTTEVDTRIWLRAERTPRHVSRGTQGQLLICPASSSAALARLSLEILDRRR